MVRRVVEPGTHQGHTCLCILHSFRRMNAAVIRGGDSGWMSNGAYFPLNSVQPCHVVSLVVVHGCLRCSSSIAANA